MQDSQEHQKELSNKEPERRCRKRMVIGLFILTTGIAIWLNIYINKLVNSFEAKWQPIVQTVVFTLLILWAFAGFWLLVYGFLSPCPSKPEY